MIDEGDRLVNYMAKSADNKEIVDVKDLMAR